MCRGIQDVLPEPLALEREPAHLHGPVMVELRLADALQEGDVLVKLASHIPPRLVREVNVTERGVEDKERHIEKPRLYLVPFQDRSAYVVAAYEHVRPGKASDGASVFQCAGDVGPGVGAQVGAVSQRLGLGAQVASHVRSADHGAVVLRVHRDDVHGDEGLDRPSARDPGHFFARLAGCLGIDVVLSHDLPHSFGRSELSLLFRIGLRHGFPLAHGM